MMVTTIVSVRWFQWFLQKKIPLSEFEKLTPLKMKHILIQVFLVMMLYFLTKLDAESSAAT